MGGTCLVPAFRCLIALFVSLICHVLFIAVKIRPHAGEKTTKLTPSADFTKALQETNTLSYS